MAMSDKEKMLFNPEKLSLVDFKILKGQIETPEEFTIEKVVGHNLENSLELGFNLEDKLVRADYSIDIKTESKGANKIEAKGSFHFVFIFKVDNLEELAIPVKDKLLDLNPGLGSALSSITYSTSRGVLITRSQGTALQNFILPVIDPTKLLHKPKS